MGRGAGRPKREDDPERKSHAALRRDRAPLAWFGRRGSSVLWTPTAHEPLTVQFQKLQQLRLTQYHGGSLPNVSQLRSSTSEFQ
ncbi:hypothetical protein STEG23_007103, partial [Scotinomys teguina]